jgi:carbon monoxide dehydrogenase subunit G
MQFEDSFTVPVDRAAVWDLLTDIERVYPCLPGAELVEVKDNEFHGMVTLRLGPITAKYQGVARFESLDAEAGRAVIDAQGRDKRGQGTVRAKIVSELTSEDDGGTLVTMSNDLEITGKAAQFGRGILQDVSKEIMAQFAANLEQMLIGPSAGEAGSDGEESGTPAATAAAGSSLSVAGLAGKVTRRKARESPVATAIVVAAIIAVIVIIILLVT